MSLKSMKCVECGADLREGAAFCTQCGHGAAGDHAAEQAPTSATCVECGKILRPNSAFCTGCGRSVGETAAAAAVAVGAGTAVAGADKAPSSSAVATVAADAKEPPAVQSNGSVAPDAKAPAANAQAKAKPQDKKSSTKKSSAPPPPSSVVAAARGTVESADATASAAQMSCGSCGKPMRPGAVKCTACGGKPAPAISDETRNSGPKGSRNLLASVGGGAAGYGSRTQGSTSAAGASKAPTIAKPAGPTPEERRKRMIIGLAAAAVLLIAFGGIALAAMGSDNTASVRAGVSSGDSSASRSRRPNRGKSTSKSDGKDSGKDTGKDTGKDSGKDSGKDTGASTPDTTKPPKGDSGGTASTTPGTPHTSPPGGGGGPGTPPPPPPPPPTNPALPPAVFQIAGSAVSMQGDSPTRSIRISNSGGQAYTYSSWVSGIPGGVTVFPASGTVGGGGHVDLTLTWNTNGSNEGQYSGTLNLNTSLGHKTVSVSVDSRKADTVGQFGWEPNGYVRCRTNSRFHLNIQLRAQGNATPAQPASILLWNTTNPTPEDPPRSILLLSPNPAQNLDAWIKYSSNSQSTYANYMTPGLQNVPPGGAPRGTQFFVKVTDLAGNTSDVFTYDANCP